MMGNMVRSDDLLDLISIRSGAAVAAGALSILTDPISTLCRHDIMGTIWDSNTIILDVTTRSYFSRVVQSEQ